MPRNRYSHSSSNRRTPNRNWTGIEIEGTAVPAASKVLLASLTLSNPGIDETVLRTIGQFGVRSDQSSATEVQIGAVGMIVVSTTALATGITAIPSPITDIEDDGWFMFAAITNFFHIHSVAGYVVNQNVIQEFNSKAKRITHDGQAIALVAENSHATHGWTIDMVFRTLSMVRGT